MKALSLSRPAWHTAQRALHRLERAILMRRGLIEAGLEDQYAEMVLLAWWSESVAFHDLDQLGLRYYARLVSARAERRELRSDAVDARRMCADWEGR